MKLMIVESPNKTKKISSILGSGWDVRASIGHIRDLPKEGLRIGADYALTYEILERSKAVIATLKQRAKQAEAVYLATDPDREGEAIAWHLKECLDLQSYSRVTFDSITDKAIHAALATPRQLDMNLVHAQEARRCTDRLVGYKVSPALSRQTQLSGVSAGRVQTVAVRLVLERQRAIEAFKETKHFGVEAVFDDGAWKAQWDTRPHLDEGQQYILDRALAERAALCTSFRVASSETKRAMKSPPPPFTTATLLQAASVTLDMKPADTARAAQRLFEQGLITYHRTDSQNFSIEALEAIRHYAATRNLPLPPAPRRWKSKEAAQEAHEAIRPTHLDERTAGDDESQRLLYRLIWQRAIASQLADAEYNVTTLRLAAEVDGQRFSFRATGRILLTPGWRSLTAEDAAEDADDRDSSDQQADDNGKVPALATGTTILADSTQILDKHTQRPKGYTQASLIKALESEGIGRPSTYHTTMTKIIQRGYIDDSKKILSATALAATIVDALIGCFAFVEYDYTRNMEHALDEIAAGKAQYFTVVSSLDTQLDTELHALQLSPRPELAAQRPPVPTVCGPVSGIPCPKCQSGFIRRPGNQAFMSCTNYATTGCTYKVNLTIAGKTLTDHQLATLITKGHTGIIKGFISKRGTTFEAMLNCTADTDWRTAFDFTKK
jgi:DNA topoisomerase-1